jgi:hypothetical protein
MFMRHSAKIGQLRRVVYHAAMRRYAIFLLLLCGCANHHKGKQWFSKNGTDCAMVMYSEQMDEWEITSRWGPAIVPTEEEAVSFARSSCGKGEIKVRSRLAPQ